MRATLKDEHGAVLIDVLGERDAVAEDFGDEVSALIADMEETGPLAIPALTTWTVAVSA